MIYTLKFLKVFVQVNCFCGLVRVYDIMINVVTLFVVTLEVYMCKLRNNVSSWS